MDPNINQNMFGDLLALNPEILVEIGYNHLKKRVINEDLL